MTRGFGASGDDYVHAGLKRAVFEKTCVFVEI